MTVVTVVTINLQPWTQLVKEDEIEISDAGAQPLDTARKSGQKTTACCSAVLLHTFYVHEVNIYIYFLSVLLVFSQQKLNTVEYCR